MTTIVCDLYLRLSDGRRENGSFEARKKVLARNVEKRGWTVGESIIENDITPNGRRNASAFKRVKHVMPDGTVVQRVRRKGFQDILSRLDSGQSQAFIAEDLDRAMRDPMDLENLIDVAFRRKCSAVSVSESLTLTKGGTDAEIYAARNAVNAAWKASADTSRRVKAARERDALDGKPHTGGNRAYGFIDGVTVDPGEAQVIRDVAKAILSGVSLRAVVRDLNARKVPTATGRGTWSGQTLKGILQRPRNTLIMAEEELRALKDTFVSVTVTYTDAKGRQVTRPRQTYVRDDKTGTVPTNGGTVSRHLGSHVYRCQCGSVVEVHAGGQSRQPTYVCTSRGDGRKHVRRNVSHVDAYVTGVVIERLSRADTAELIAPPSGVDLPALRTERKALRERKTMLTRLAAAGSIDEADLVVGTEDIRRQLATVDAKLLEATKVSALAELLAADDKPAAWESMPLGSRRAAIDELMTVTILPATRKGSGFDPDAVRIDWKANDRS